MSSSTTSPRPPQSPQKKASNLRLHFPGSSPSASSPKLQRKQSSSSSPQTARPSTTGGLQSGPPGLATFSFPIDDTNNNGNNTSQQDMSDFEGKKQHTKAPSMRQQLTFAMGESTRPGAGGSPSSSSPMLQNNNNNNNNSHTSTTNQSYFPSLSSSSAGKSVNNTSAMSFEPHQDKVRDENIRREKAAEALAEALLKWPSTANPLRAPANEANIRRRIATSSSSRTTKRTMMMDHNNNNSGDHQPNTTNSMADTVLNMIDKMSSVKFDRSRRKSTNTIVQTASGEFTTVHPSEVSNQRRNNRKKRQHNGDVDPLQDEDDNDEDFILSGDDGDNAATGIQHKYPPRHHRPAQRDFLSWSNGAASGFESFASVSRWVDWVLQEAQFHSNRIEKEEGNKSHLKDTLDLAEVMKSNFDGLLVDAATYYEEIQERATEINDCVHAWSRGRKRESRHPTSSETNDNNNKANIDDNNNSDSNNIGPGETFLVRAAFLVLDRVLSSSTMMNSVWPRIRTSLLKGLYVKGDTILDSVLKPKILEQQKKAAASGGTTTTTDDENSSGIQKPIFLTTEEISLCLANNTLIMEQYDELLSQFRDAERQRFHLESTTSQLSAFSDLTARHTSRRLIRSAFKAWRQVAHQGKISERLIVHFARQSKAKEIVGRNLHRWRSYMQMQKRNRAVKYSDEIRRKMNQEKAAHEAELKKIKTDHEREVSNYEIRLLHLQQQYDAAVEGANLERTTLEGEIEKLNKQLDKAEHHVQQWRTAALLSRPTEGPDAIALYSDEQKQKLSVAEMSLALAPPSKKLQVLVSVVRGTEDALYLATLRTAQEAGRAQAARIAAQRRQLSDTNGGNNGNMSASIASPTQASLARSSNSPARNPSRLMSPAGVSGFAESTQQRKKRPRSRGRGGEDESKNKTPIVVTEFNTPKRSGGGGGTTDSLSSTTQQKMTESVKKFEVGEGLPNMDFNENNDDGGDDHQNSLSASMKNNGNNRSRSSSPANKSKPAFKLFVKGDDDQALLSVTQNSPSLAQTLRSSTTANALNSRPDMNFQSLAAAARESITAFLVEWVNEMLARSSQGRTMMHAGVQRTQGGSTVAKTISNLDTDLYDGSVYLSLCKVLLPPEHQRKGDADVFSTIVSTLFVFTAHGLQAPLIVHCPFYRRFFRADTFGTFIHPTAGLWIVSSLFCGYALRSAQSPNYRAHPGLTPVHQYSPSGHHKVSKSAQQRQQQFRFAENNNNTFSSMNQSMKLGKSSRRRKDNNNDDSSNQGGSLADVPVTRPPMNILIMGGVNTCGYGTKKAFTTSMARGDAALLHRLGVNLDKTMGTSSSGHHQENNSTTNNNNDNEASADADRKRRRRSTRKSFSSLEQESSFGDTEFGGYDDDDFGEEDEEGEEGDTNNSEDDNDDDDDDDIFRDQDDDEEQDEENIVEELDDDELPAAAGTFSPSKSLRNKRKQTILSQKELMDNWLTTREAVEAAQKAVPEHLLNLGPTELLQYWRTAQENRSIWIGMARVITSLAVRFRVFDIDTKRTEQNTARRHMQPHMTSMMTSELKMDSTKSPSSGKSTLR